MLQVSPDKTSSYYTFKKYWKYLLVYFFFKILNIRTEVPVLHPEYGCLPCQYYNMYRAFLDLKAEF